MTGNFSNDGTASTQCPPKSNIKRLWLEDLEEAEKIEVARHVEQCEKCKATIAEFERERQEFLEKNPPEKIEAQVLTGVEKRLKKKRRFIINTIPSVTLVLFFIAVFTCPHFNPKSIISPKPTISPEPTIRTKGDVSIELWLQSGEEAVKAGPGQSFKAGDRIQFKYTSGANSHVFLVSLDEAGRVSNFNHDMFGESKKIVPGGGMVLEGSIILDESIEAERVFAIFSNEPIKWQEVELAAKQAHDELGRGQVSLSDLKRLPLEYPQASVLLQKSK